MELPLKARPTNQDVRPSVDFGRFSKGGSNDAQWVQNLVAEAKTNLKTYLDSTTKFQKIFAMRKIGLNEGLSFMLMLAALDANGDGILSPEELATFHEQSQIMIDAHLNALTNSGVVSALILSVIFPIAYAEKVDGNASGYKYVEYISLQCALATAITTVFCAAGVHTHLSFYLPNNRLRVWYINELNQRHIMPCIEILKNISLVLLGVSLLYGQLQQTVFPLNLVCVVPIVLLLVAVAAWGHGNDNVIKPRLFDYASDLSLYDVKTAQHNALHNGAA
jgi:hypothetical protein